MKHCWHETGTSYTSLYQRITDVICCNCGVESSREYREETKGLRGHGKYFTRRVEVPLPVRCDVECEVK